MAPSHTEVGRTEAEILEEIAVAFEARGYDFPPFEAVRGVGLRKYIRADRAAEFRAVNPTFKGLSIPYAKGFSSDGGASVLTPRFVRGEWSLAGVINYLIDEGLIDQMIDEWSEKLDHPEFAEGDVLYSIYIVAKGWVAEAQVDQHVDELSKMGESHDIGGIDFQKTDSDPEKPEYVQLRSWTWAAMSKDADKTDKGIPVVYYGWHNGELILSDSGYDVREILADGMPVRDRQRKYEFLF